MANVRCQMSDFLMSDFPNSKLETQNPQPETPNSELPSLIYHLSTSTRNSELLKINPYRLIKKLSLHDGSNLSCFFRKTLESEKTGSIAFIDCDFQVAGAVE